MTALLGELSKRLAERWATVVLGPGLLFVVAALVGYHLGWEHALDAGRVRHLLSPTSRPDTASLVIDGVLLAVTAAFAGLAAAALGGLIEKIFMITSPVRLGTVLTRRRQARWRTADEKLTTALQRAGREHALARLAASPVAPDDSPARLRRRRDRIAPELPQRPTWMADRLHRVERRVAGHYHLDLPAAWPHLWSVMPEPQRQDLAAAQDGYAGAARLTAWGIGYLLLGICWWPALLVGAVAAVSGWRRARTAVTVLAALLEAAVDLRGRDLAVALGVECAGALTPAVGDQITALLAKPAAA
jgi:hypothetical protein